MERSRVPQGRVNDPNNPIHPKKGPSAKCERPVCVVVKRPVCAHAHLAHTCCFDVEGEWLQRGEGVATLRHL